MSTTWKMHVKDLWRDILPEIVCKFQEKILSWKLKIIFYAPFRLIENRHNYPFIFTAPRDYLLQNLSLKARNTTKNSTFLKWSSGEAPETARHSSLKLGGYLLTVKSFDHLIERKLRPELINFTQTDLKPWTEYNITLRRFYIAVDEEEILPMKVGRAATVTIRTNPSGECVFRGSLVDPLLSI